MKIHQFVHTLQYGDAISGEAVALKRTLIEEGFESEIYYVNAHELMKEFGSPFTQFADEECAVILHYSIASPLNDLFLQLARGFKVVVYHNLTPERWFSAYNFRVCQDLIRARSQLEAVIKASDLVLCDSTYNMSEVMNYAPRAVAVFPLVLDCEKWSIPSNVGISVAARTHGGKNLLTVGRIAPNKCLEDVLKIFYFYNHKIDRTSRLWIAGSDTDTEIYKLELERLIAHLRLKHAVTFVGAVADSELKSLYESADVYLCMSEHEGFCVPLIEAMHFGVPIVAYDSCAVRETLGSGGVLVQEKRYDVLASICGGIIQDPESKQAIVQKQREQVENYSLTAFKERVRAEVIRPVSSWFDRNQSRQAQGGV